MNWVTFSWKLFHNIHQKMTDSFFLQGGRKSTSQSERKGKWETEKILLTGLSSIQPRVQTIGHTVAISVYIMDTARNKSADVQAMEHLSWRCCHDMSGRFYSLYIQYKKGDIGRKLNLGFLQDLYLNSIDILINIETNTQIS
jgi:hypothetical protein